MASGNGSGAGGINALNDSGNIAAVEAANTDGHLQAVVWRGDNWQEKIPLPGLAPGNTPIATIAPPAATLRPLQNCQMWMQFKA